MNNQQVSAVSVDLSEVHYGQEENERRLIGAFKAEEREGQDLAIRGRTIALLAIAVLICFVASFPAVLYYHGLLAVFVMIGIVYHWMSRHDRIRGWHAYAFATLEFALLGFVLIYPNPFTESEFAPQMSLRNGNIVYFFVLLCGLTFSYRPRLMLWGGLVGAAAWAVGVLWVAMLPATTLRVSEELPGDAVIAQVLAPTFVDLSQRLQEVVVFMIVAGLLAVVVARSRRLVMRQVDSERERGNLARYFPPSMVDRLARMDAPLSQVREQDVAVLFADVVGFTRWSENRSPTEVIAFLREVHSRLERSVFDHGGTLDKFIGDGVMATFGTPETGPDDAANALRASRSILRSFDDWNVTRVEQGEEPVTISVGVHYGTVVVGDIGSERRLEFAVLGDTVNVASRLERLTRKTGCRAVVSDDVIAAVRRQCGDGEAAGMLEGIAEGAAEEIRGRKEAVRIWTL